MIYYKQVMIMKQKYIITAEDSAKIKEYRKQVVFVNEKVYQLLTKKYTTFASEFVYHFGTHVSAANKKIVTEALLTGREMVLPLIMSRSPLAEKNMNPTCKPFLFHDKIAVQQFGGFCS